MASAPGSPGTSLICWSWGVTGSQSSFWPNEEEAKNRHATQIKYRRLGTVSSCRCVPAGEVVALVYTKTYGLTRAIVQSEPGRVFLLHCDSELKENGI